MSTMTEMLARKEAEAIADRLSGDGLDGAAVYAASIVAEKDLHLAAVKAAGRRYILAAGKAGALKGKAHDGYLLCPFDEANAAELRRLLPWTAPRACGKEVSSFGTGDRLGIAGPAHIRAVKGKGVFPVLAQQSMRELTQTERNYRDVVDCGTWSVFQEGFKDGFGADGDHLKNLEDIRMAVETGMRMITLDLSDKLRGDAFDKTKEELEEIFEEEFDEDEREALLIDYENKEFQVEIDGEKRTLKFIYKDVLRNVICYYRGIEYAEEVYRYLQGAVGEGIDFEISIDEVGFPTKPKSHYFVASELEKRQIEIASLAPCFVGEFQKAIDYIGDIARFEDQLKLHFAISNQFGGYKLSIHSGSDKFSVYPAIGAVTGGKYHVKTAGTSWVEAMKLIALKRPALYREVHAFALEMFAEAAKLYHVTTDLGRIPALDTLKDAELVDLFANNDARQLIHITYGFILRAKDAKGGSRFRTRLYQAWNEEEPAHYDLVQAHIGKHVDLLKGQ